MSNSFITDASAGDLNNKQNTGQLAPQDENNYAQEAGMSRKLEFEKGNPLSYGFASNKIFTIPYTFRGYLTFIGKKIAETPLNLCMVVVLLYYLISFICKPKEIKQLDLLFSVSFHLLIFVLEFFGTTINYIEIYLNDLKVNNQKAHVYDNEERNFIDTPWKKIQVGQIIKVNKDEVVPADIIILEAMDHKHQCYLDNSSISGNFDKFAIRKACNDTHAPSMKVIKFSEYVKNIKGILKYDEPNSNMYSFNGRLKLESFPRASNINQENFVMRGATVKNVKHVYGLVVYTGMETKMMMTLKYTQGTVGSASYGESSTGSNIQTTKNQFSNVIIKKDNEIIRQSLKFMQYLIIIFYVVILLVLFLINLHESVNLYLSDKKKNIHFYRYLYLDVDQVYTELFISFTKFVLTFHIVMPFNWFGLIDISYWILSSFIKWDENIKRNNNEVVEIINSHSLANFGQVRHILTDKTGTLTKRKFELKLCSIQGKLYDFDLNEQKDENYIFRIKEEDVNDLEIMQELNNNSKYSSLIKEFIEALCLCHSVKVSNLSNIKKKGEVKNKDGEKVGGQGVVEDPPAKNDERNFASPYAEEVATFKMLGKLGYRLIKSKSNLIQLKINELKKNYFVIGHNKYNKDRNKMSIVIRSHSTNGSYLFCKANDTSVFDLIKKEEANSPKVEKSKSQIKELSKFGFRYFVILKKELNEEETYTFINKYKSAENYVVKSDEHLNNLAIEYERDLSLMGIIFLEEKIDQDLKFSIARLNNAGIKVWVASGDKRENVLSIGRALDLYDQKSIRGDFSDKDKPEDLDIKMSTLLMQFLFPNDKINKMKTRTGANVDVKSMKSGGSKDLTILISGNCFTKICNDQRNFQSLATLLSFCTSLLAYQFSPNNKFVLCQMIKNYCSKNSRLLAVGDGFNDFSMLREADLSIGICSREILQVRNTCDAIVSNFSQIVDLILVQGTWSYRRILEISIVSFYIHFLLIFPKILYMNYNRHGSTFYDEFDLIFVINVLIMNLFCIFTLSYDVPVERALITLNYNVYKGNFYDNSKMVRKFGLEIFRAFIDAAILFFFNKELMEVSANNIKGEVIDNKTFGIAVLNTSYMLIIVKTIGLRLRFINGMHILFVILCLGCLVGVTFIDSDYKHNVLLGFSNFNTVLSNLFVIGTCFIYEYIIKVIIFLLDRDFIIYLSLVFKRSIANFLFLKNYQQLFTNVSRENPKTLNKLDKITYPEVLDKIYSHNKTLDPALENMADVTNDDVSNLKIKKPILQFFDKKIEMDYIEYCDNKIAMSYLVYLFSMALFLAIAIALENFNDQKVSKSIKIVYIICGLVLLVPNIQKRFTNAFCIYFAIIVVLEIILVYVERNKTDNDTKLCLQICVLLSFPLYSCPNSQIIILITALYLIGITPAFYLNDFGIDDDDSDGYDKYFLHSNLCLIYIRHAAVLSSVVLMFISSYYVKLKNRIEFLKYHKSRVELKKDNLIMSNLVPDFVRAKMQRGERGAAYGYEEVTIVFCDISNFDDLMAKLSPKDIISFLDEFYSVLDQFCQLHGLQKIETVGKTYMAAGGIKECEIDVDPTLLVTHHSLRCFEFAVDILDLVQNMILNSGDKITVKIGIHKGRVIPAVVGDHKPQFSLIGDTVNTTSRMASNGEKNCITCSEFAYEEIKRKYKDFNVSNKQIKGKGLMNLYSYSLKNSKKQAPDPKNPVLKDQQGNLVIKSNTKNVPVLVKQNTKNSKRKNSIIKSNDMGSSNSLLSGKNSVIEDSMIIVDNSLDLLVKTGGNLTTNPFEDLNRFGNDTAAYNSANNSMERRGRSSSGGHMVEKRESKFEKIKNTYFTDSVLFYKFKNEVAENGFKRFEKLLVSSNKDRGIYVNIILGTFLIFYSYVFSHYSNTDTHIETLLIIKTTLIVLLIILSFYINNLMQNSTFILFILISLIFLTVSIVNIIFNNIVGRYLVLNMTCEEIIILTCIESCGLLNYLQISINFAAHIVVYIVDSINNRKEKLVTKYNVLLTIITLIKFIHIISLYYEMTVIFLANSIEGKTLVDTEKMLFNLMPLHVVQNMKDDIPVADVLENVTLLFADIVRYTDFGNCHEPVEVVKMLMELFKNFDHATKDCHVYKVHTIGDCYVVMGFNGKVSMNERNYYEEAKNVCKMGEEMISIIRDVRKKVNYELLDMRIGIHTGTVIAGIIGSSVVRYDIFGSDVLIANKMESSGSPGRINISEETKRLLESKDLPFNLTLNKVVHIDSVNKDITCFLIDNGNPDKK